MRFFYNVLIYLLLPLFALYWVLRGIGNRRYFDRLGQRFGFGFPKLDRCIWVHAVSVGEVQASAPLVRALLERFPQTPLLITTVTPTGAAHVDKIFGTCVVHCYLPFEFPDAVSRFFRAVNPIAAMIMETEIWPNLYRACGVRDIPLILVSARISPRSVPGYRRMLPLIRETLSHGIIIAAQSQADADRFLELGANAVRTWVTGSIKFDIALDEDLPEKGQAVRRSLFGERPVWVAASTHEGEERIVLAAHKALQEKIPELLLVLVPRHPERFESVRTLAEKEHFTVVARTDKESCRSETDVFLLDTMGELTLFYATGDIAFVGGSLVPIGGHNLLEPAALGLPIVTGPHVFNAQDVANKLLESAACRTVNDTDELADVVAALLQDKQMAQAMGDNAAKVLAGNRGSLQRLMVLLEPLLDPAAN